MTKNQRRITNLLDKLRQDADSPKEADELLPVVQRLVAWQAPVPTRCNTARLIAALGQVLSREPEARFHNPPSTIRNPKFLWQLMRAQLGVVHREIWWASALVMGLGVLVTLASDASAPLDATLPFALVAPIVTAVGMAFLYGPTADPAIEIELAAPVSSRMILLARLALVFGFDLGLGLAGSAALSFLHSNISFWPLVSAWLAPMTFLSMLALLLTVLTLDSGLGMLVSLGLWIVQCAARFRTWSDTPWLLALPDLTAGAQAWLWPLALLLGGLALGISGHEERWLKEQA